MKENVSGIILGGGKGSRLFPLTKVVNKHFLAIYSKPMIYYPISVMMQLGIRDILIICTPQDEELYQRELKFLTALGVNLRLVVQNAALGIAHAIKLGLDQVTTKYVCAILGDNIFLNLDIKDVIKTPISDAIKMRVFSCEVENPEMYGVVKRDSYGDIVQLIEKPLEHVSNEVLTGIYLFDTEYYQTKMLSAKCSSRGEFEITNILQVALRDKALEISKLPGLVYWKDAGGIEDLLKAANYVREIEIEQQTVICSPELTACENRWITTEGCLALVHKYPAGNYKNSLSAAIMRQLQL